MESKILNNENVNISEKLNSYYNQDHLLKFLTFIGSEEKKNKYLNQIEKTDFEMLKKLFNYYQNSHSGSSNKTDEVITPIESTYSLNDICKDTNMQKELLDIGMNKVNEGKVALLILAGGQGSRLGFNKAKGMYNINMPSQKTLFEYLCNRFLSAQNFSKNIQNKNSNSDDKFSSSLLLIMTSIENHEETVEFFKQNNYFNINPADILFFPQDTLAALDLEGKIINKGVDELFEAPNGNGGCFIAMKKHGILEKCLNRGVEFIHVISIDNPMSKPLDPIFVGVTVKEGKAGELQMSAKCVPKREPAEPVGVFLNQNGKPAMMDYGDMPKNLTELRNEKGELVYRGGNILNYLISTKFLYNVLLDEKKYDELISEFHISKKKIPCVKFEKGNVISTHTNGIKFEIFFNSIFSFAEKDGLLLLEVNREDEFAPVKNSENSVNDNPRTARKMMTDQFTKWYVNSGGIFNNESNIDYLLEFSYLMSYAGENINPGVNVPKNVTVTNDNNQFYFKF